MAQKIFLKIFEIYLYMYKIFERQIKINVQASSTPLHDEGLLGDAVTFLLTANYATEETDARFKKYFAAQAKGQVRPPHSLTCLSPPC